MRVRTIAALWGMILLFASGCSLPMNFFWQVCPTEETINALESYQFAVVEDDKIYDQIVSQGEKPIALKPLQESYVQILKNCNLTASIDLTSPSHWIYSKEARVIAATKALELAMAKGEPIQLKTGPETWKMYGTLWNYLLETDVHLVIITSKEKNSGCCAGDLQLADEKLIENGSVVLPQFEIPLKGLIYYATSADAVPGEHTIFSSSAIFQDKTFNELLTLYGLPVQGYQPEYAVTAAKFYNYTPDGLDPSKPENQIPQPMDWAVALYGTLLHEMSHRKVGKHNCGNKDNSIDDAGAYYIHFKALDRILHYQANPKDTFPFLNPSEELVVVRTVRGLLDGVFCEPKDWPNKFTASGQYIEKYDGYWKYCEGKIDPKIIESLKYKFEFTECWKDVSITKF